MGMRPRRWHAPRGRQRMLETLAFVVMLRCMRSLGLVVSRSLLVLGTLLPMWLAYLVPAVRTLRFGATLPTEHWDRLHARWAERFRRLAITMRGGLIKVGQVLSTRVDLLPVRWIDVLSTLQDQVEPCPWREIEPHVVRAYEGRDPRKLFASFDEHATAAASFGQVHRATTVDGEKVALKIRYPDAELKLAVDFGVLRLMLPLFNFFVPQVRLLPIFQEIRRALEVELDYEQEARFTETIHANMAGVEGVHVPRVIRELTRREVICTTWFEGVKITDPALLADPRLDRAALLDRVIEAWVKMMYVDGVFQSDPHPGNVLARIGPSGPEICVVDFGQVKILTKAFHEKLLRSVMAFMTRDQEAFARSLLDIGLFGEADLARVRPLLARIFEKYEAVSDGGLVIDFGWFASR
jgi:predicted unusual protein kinase regulating ubiquinone biosynthesis (AarF/ABC1/UbiB family)